MVKKVTTLGALLAVLLLTWIPITSFALGLGPITMRSALNQPLQAEIEIHSAQPGDLDGLAVRLAADEDFARVNVERSSFLGRILFQVQLRSDGSPYILLSTKEPVTEPYLDFLIEARWARGRALKEYTVLVDPPVLTDETPAPVQQSVTAPVFSQPVPQTSRPVRSAPPVQQREQPRQEATRQSAPPRVATPTRRQAPQVATGDGSYRVQRNDTLSEIAQKMRPDGVSVNQMMLALLKANPSAFYNNNINQLKAGFVLRLDDAESATAISRREANAEVREQIAAWREGRPSRLVQQAESDVAEADDSGSSSASDTSSRVASADESARLKLVAPGQEGAGSGSGSDSGKTSSKLQQELLLATEALDANRAETDELKTRLSDLEEQLASMQRLINLKDEEMSALQRALKEGQPVSEQVEEAAAKPETAKPPKPVSAKDESVVDSFLSDTTMLGLVAILVLGVVAWLVIRRRKMQEGFQESILNVGMADSVARADSTMPGESNMVSDFAMSGMEPIQADTADVDPISEADVYLAYGRHQQAEDIIKQALQKNPDRLDLQAKLLEVMHAANNRAGFEKQAQVMYDKLGGDESNDYWAKAVALGSQIAPHNPLFGGGMNSVDDSDDLVGHVGNVTADEEDLLDFDFDEDETFNAASDSRKAGSNTADDDLDFDVSALDFDLGDDTTASSISNIDAFDNDDNSIDFDLTDEGDLEVASTSKTSKHNKPKAAASEELLSLDDDDHIDLDALEIDSSDSGAEKSGLSLVGDLSGSNELSLEDIHNEAEEFDVELDLDEEVEDRDNTVVAFESASNSDDDLSDDIFADVDEIGTKLDLAKAYVDMGDSDGARSILDEVLEEGDDSQKQQAEQLLQQMG